MNELHTIKHCPICESTSFHKTLTAKDYTVSQKNFDVVECDQCGFWFTNPIPSENTIGEYYKSESYISHSSTNKGVISKLYHLVRSYTLKQKVKLVNRLTKGKTHLDLGAGTGHFVNQMKLAGFSTFGLEPDEDARNFAKNEFNVELKSPENIYSLEPNSLDVITMWHVLEHVFHLKKDVKALVQALKHDGVFIVAVPNRLSFDAQFYKEFWAAYDLPIHLYHFRPEDISNLFELFHLEVKEILPMKFDSYYVSMLSEKYKGGNILKAFWIGWLSNLKAKQGFYSSQIYVLKKKAI